MSLIGETGSACNRVVIGGETHLLGDPTIRTEKPHTIVIFPGGHVEIARTEDGEYWVHLAVRETSEWHRGSVKWARLDHAGRSNDGGNVALCEALAAGDLNHAAFLVMPGGRR